MQSLHALIVAAAMVMPCLTPSTPASAASIGGSERIRTRTGDRELPGTLRVRLLEKLSPRLVTVEAPYGGLQAYVDGSDRPSLIIPEGQRVTLTVSGSDARLEASTGTVQGSELRLVAPSGEAVTLQTGSSIRSYRGEVWAATERSVLRLVNHVPLEDYVASVVSAEYGLDDLEGSKAMAVIARTYAIKVLKSADYDQVDHTLSQVYKGTRAVTPLALAAASATRGEVLTYEGDLIEAVYSSSSGGHTANNEDVWQSRAHPYLRGRKDPWDTVSPHHEWQYEVSASQLHAMTRRAFGIDVRSIDVADRSDDGRVRTLTLEASNGRSRRLSAQEFRLQVISTFGPTALRSTYFDVRRSGDTYVFDGRGFGHGVGLSQWGAHAMALDGRSYREIIDFYYRGVSLERGRASDDAPMPIHAARSHDSDDAGLDEVHPETTDAVGGRIPSPTLAAPTGASTSGDSGRSVRNAAVEALLNAARTRTPAGWGAGGTVRRDSSNVPTVSGPPPTRKPGSTSRVISRRAGW